MFESPRARQAKPLLKRRFRRIGGSKGLQFWQPHTVTWSGLRTESQAGSQAGIEDSSSRSRRPMLHLPRQLSRTASIQANTTNRM